MAKFNVSELQNIHKLQKLHEFWKKCHFWGHKSCHGSKKIFLETLEVVSKKFIIFQKKLARLRHFLQAFVYIWYI